MPSLWTVHLGVDDPTDIRPEHIHAVVGGWLDGGGHHDQRKPFSITPLWHQDGRGWGFDLGLVDDAREPDLLAACSWKEIRLGRRMIQLPGTADELLTRRDRRSWRDLMSAGEPRRSWTFTFESPVTFRMGNHYQPLPVPGSVFGHLRTWWRHFADVPVPDADFKRSGLVVEHLEGRTVELSLRRRTLVGFIGQVTYRAHCSDDLAIGLDCLVGLAPFSGIGSHTAFGLGLAQVR